jgi:lipoate-protein ligase A
MKELDRRFFVVPYSKGTAKFNMDRDLEFFNGFFKERTGLRLYGWTERCITYGRNQKVNETGLPSARRPTGGGMVVHSTDISFSFFIHPRSPLWTPSVRGTYFQISNLIKDALRKKGFEVDYPGEISDNKKRREMCFERAEPHELVLNRKKVMGCALLKEKQRFLAQGTIFLDISPREFQNALVDVLKERGFEVHIMETR